MGIPAPAPCGRPRAARTRRYLAALGLSVASIVTPAVLAGPAAHAHAQTAVIRPAPRALAAWRAAIRHAPTPGHGCFNATYPALRWHAVKCRTALNVPFGPGRSAGTSSRLTPAVGGRNNADFVAQVNGNISQATGSFSHVSPVITETDSSQANEFTLQLNSNNTPQEGLCRNGPNYGNGCVLGQQFLYASGGTTTSGSPPEIFIQYWVHDLGAPCANIGLLDSGAFGECFANSFAAQVPQLTASDLASVTLTGTTSATTGDTVKLTLGSTAYAASGGDLGLNGNWNQTQWGVYGSPNLSGVADFGPGSYLEADTSFMASTGGAAPNCIPEINYPGTTLESNNLKLSTTTAPPSLGVLPTVASFQTTGTQGTATCANQPAAQPGAVAPSISPAAYSVTHLAAGNSAYSCPSGQLCLQVDDPTTSGTTVFDLYYCKTYALSHWYNSGTYIDNQTGKSTTTYFYGASTSQVLAHFTPTGIQLNDYNWTPVNWIKPC
jgi:hypothetical protein